MAWRARIGFPDVKKHLDTLWLARDPCSKLFWWFVVRDRDLLMFPVCRLPSQDPFLLLVPSVPKGYSFACRNTAKQAPSATARTTRNSSLLTQDGNLSLAFHQRSQRSLHLQKASKVCTRKDGLHLKLPPFRRWLTDHISKLVKYLWVSRKGVWHRRSTMQKEEKRRQFETKLRHSTYCKPYDILAPVEMYVRLQGKLETAICRIQEQSLSG